MAYNYDYKVGDIVVYHDRGERRITAKLIQRVYPNDRNSKWWQIRIITDTGWCEPGYIATDCIDSRWRLKTKNFPRLGIGGVCGNKRIYTDDECWEH